MTATMVGAALYYAERGLRVFPLTPGSKKPFKGSNGCLDATGNPDVINGWWAGDPQANVGIATGFRIDVVDIDPPQGQESRAAWWCHLGPECPTRGMKRLPWDVEDCGHGGPGFIDIDAMALGKVLTPRTGAMHIYIPATGEGNRAHRAPGIDFRGRGGYVVAPPSVLIPYEGCPQGGSYRFLGTPQLERPPVAP